MPLPRTSQKHTHGQAVPYWGVAGQGPVLVHDGAGSQSLPLAIDLIAHLIGRLPKQGHIVSYWGGPNGVLPNSLLTLLGGHDPRTLLGMGGNSSRILYQAALHTLPSTQNIGDQEHWISTHKITCVVQRGGMFITWDMCWPMGHPMATLTGIDNGQCWTGLLFP